VTGSVKKNTAVRVLPPVVTGTLTFLNFSELQRQLSIGPLDV